MQNFDINVEYSRKLIPNGSLHLMKKSCLSLRTVKYNIPIWGIFSDAFYTYIKTESSGVSVSIWIMSLYKEKRIRD